MPGEGSQCSQSKLDKVTGVTACQRVDIGVYVLTTKEATKRKTIRLEMLYMTGFLSLDTKTRTQHKRTNNRHLMHNKTQTTKNRLPYSHKYLLNITEVERTIRKTKSM